MTTALKQEPLSPADQLRVQLGIGLNTPQKRDVYVAGIVEKWGAAGWLNQDLCKTDKAKAFHEKLEKVNCAELKGDYQLKEMSLILENQLFFQRDKERVVEGQIVDGNRVRFNLTQAGETTTADEALPTREVMPIIRRIYAIVLNNDISRVQTMAGPSSYVFWLDFIRATSYLNGSLSDRNGNESNFLSIEYGDLVTPELGVPAKAKLKLTQQLITAIKQMIGVTWSTESEEDAKALLNLNIESELMRETGQEIVRDLFARHLGTILQASQGAFDPSPGYNLPGIWQNHLPSFTIPNLGGSQSLMDYKQAIYSTLIQADTQFLRANRRPPEKIIAGYGMAGFLQNLNTATGTQNPNRGDMASVGISNYGTYAGRWGIVGTEFLPDNFAIMYVPNPDPLHAGHVYAPYVPVQAGPKVYADYDENTGQFLNVDAWTRTLRERSGEKVTRPYSFQLLIGPSGGFGQFT